MGGSSLRVDSHGFDHIWNRFIVAGTDTRESLYLLGDWISVFQLHLFLDVSYQKVFVYKILTLNILEVSDILHEVPILRQFLACQLASLLKFLNYQMLNCDLLRILSLLCQTFLSGVIVVFNFDFMFRIGGDCVKCIHLVEEGVVEPVIFSAGNCLLAFDFWQRL